MYIYNILTSSVFLNTTNLIGLNLIGTAAARDHQQTSPHQIIRHMTAELATGGGRTVLLAAVLLSP